MENLPLFINSSFSEGIPRMKVVYDDVTQTQIHAEVSYRANEKLRVSLSAQHIIYDMLHEDKPWNLPATTVSLSGSYNLADKILVTTDLFFRGNTYAKNPDSGEIISIDTWADVNLGAEYRYSKILSVFLKLNNLGFSRYYVWSNYPSERFNVLAGISYAF
jgi:outer membrane receptor protein involved in Fe transport